MHSYTVRRLSNVPDVQGAQPYRRFSSRDYNSNKYSIHRNESTNFAPAGLIIIKPRCRETKRCGRTTALNIKL